MDLKGRWVLLFACFIFGGCLVQQQQDLTVLEVKNTQDTFTPSTRDDVLGLFRQNDLSLEGLVVREVSEDDLGFTHIRCDKILQGLPVFKEEVFFRKEAC
jgi:hypothetical protein